MPVIVMSHFLFRRKILLDISQLKQKIIDNADVYIPNILTNIGCHKIKDLGKEFRAAKEGHFDGTAICVNKRNLFSIYRAGEEIRGDIFVLVQKFKNITFYESIAYVCEILGIENSFKEIVFPFNGYYKKFKDYLTSNYEIELKTYPEIILEEYYNVGSEKFLKDGISLSVQKEFNIGYDLYEDRITIPWRNSEGLLVGIVGRYNDSHDFCKKEGIPKYLPLISFQKSQCLYGFYENYNYIVNNTVIIFEAEKSVLQLKSMGLNSGIAVGMSTISSRQKQLIMSLFPEKIIIAFDEGIEESQLILQANNLVPKSDFFNCKVGYIYDRNNTYLEKDSKKSPTDIGKEKFEELMGVCLTFIN
jgi:hypothetical protein